jgi:beta-ribofuranosylaminobenzene 5'-phosphate synthase
MICEIEASGRIHAGLIDLSADGYRINGGVGWSIGGPNIVVRASGASALEILDKRSSPLPSGELEALQGMVRRFADAHGRSGVRIEIEGELAPHRGLGSGTTVRLAMLEACATAWEIDVAASELVKHSGRGGTSGVGVRTYFEGGLVIDLGHRRGARAGPSRDRTAEGPPLPLLRIDMPRWRFGLFRPPNCAPVEIAREREVFDQALPIPRADVHGSLYDILYGIVGAVMESDDATFALAIDTLQTRKWKRAEWALHGDALTDRAEDLRMAGARGIGLSSMGPTLFFLGGKTSEDAKEWPLGVQWVPPNNGGRKLRRI